MYSSFYPLFSKTAHIHFIKRQAILRDNGIDFPPHILRIIKKNDGISQNELAKQLCHAPASVTPLVNKLEQNNFIIRKSDDIDMRKKRVYITKKGIDCLDQTEEILKTFSDICYKDFTTEEMEQFTFLITKMYNNLAKDGELI